MESPLASVSSELAPATAPGSSFASKNNAPPEPVKKPWAFTSVTDLPTIQMAIADLEALIAAMGKSNAA